MKLCQILIPSVFILLLIGGGGYFLYNVYFGNILLNEQISNNLITVAESKAERIKYFLDESKKDLEFLVSSEEVLSTFDRGYVVDEDGDFLRSFQMNNEYLDIILINMKGVIVFSGNDEDLIGVDVSDSGDKLSEVFNKVKKDFGVGIFDPGYFGLQDKLSIFVTSPVLVESNIEDKKDMNGIVVLQIENKEIEDKVSEDIGFGDMGEIYLVNRDGTLITKPNSDVMVSKISTEMYRNCFQDYDNYYFERSGLEVSSIEKSGIYHNYVGKEVYGAHQYMLQTGWCVMVELDKKEFFNLIFENERNKYLDFLYLFSSLFVFFSIFVIIFSKYTLLGGRR